MAITTSSGSFKTLFSTIAIYTSVGTSVPSSKFTITEYSAITGSLTNYVTITFETEHGFNCGDEVDVTFGNRVLSSIVNDVTSNSISLVNRLPIGSAGGVTVKKRWNLVALNDLDVGEYYMHPTNEILVVRNSFCNPYITTAELGAVYTDALTLDRGIEVASNYEALNRVYSDLNGLGDVYDAVWFSRIRQLKIYAMLSMLFPKHETFTTEYKNLIKATRNLNVVDPETGEVENTVAYADWGWY